MIVMHSRARGAYLVSFADAVVKPFIIIIIIIIIRRESWLPTMVEKSKKLIKINTLLIDFLSVFKMY